MILNCWRDDPKRRPKFDRVLYVLKKNTKAQGAAPLLGYPFIARSKKPLDSAVVDPTKITGIGGVNAKPLFPRPDETRPHSIPSNFQAAPGARHNRAQERRHLSAARGRLERLMSEESGGNYLSESPSYEGRGYGSSSEATASEAERWTSDQRSAPTTPNRVTIVRRTRFESSMKQDSRVRNDGAKGDRILPSSYVRSWSDTYDTADESGLEVLPSQAPELGGVLMSVSTSSDSAQSYESSAGRVEMVSRGRVNHSPSSALRTGVAGGSPVLVEALTTRLSGDSAQSDSRRQGRAVMESRGRLGDSTARVLGDGAVSSSPARLLSGSRSRGGEGTPGARRPHAALAPDRERGKSIRKSVPVVSSRTDSAPSQPVQDTTPSRARECAQGSGDAEEGRLGFGEAVTEHSRSPVTSMESADVPRARDDSSPRGRRNEQTIDGSERKQSLSDAIDSSQRGGTKRKSRTRDSTQSGAGKNTSRSSALEKVLPRGRIEVIHEPVRPTSVDAGQVRTSFAKAIHRHAGEGDRGVTDSALPSGSSKFAKARAEDATLETQEKLPFTTHAAPAVGINRLAKNLSEDSPSGKDRLSRGNDAPILRHTRTSSGAGKSVGGRDGARNVSESSTRKKKGGGGRGDKAPEVVFLHGFKLPGRSKGEREVR